MALLLAIQRQGSKVGMSHSPKRLLPFQAMNPDTQFTVNVPVPEGQYYVMGHNSTNSFETIRHV
jgi:hypothetical protein